MVISIKFRRLAPSMATFLLHGAEEIRNLGKHLSLTCSSLALSISYLKIVIAQEI